MKEKNIVYEDVCAKLDKLSIEMLDAMKEYIDCKVIVESYIKTGSIHLAKARYIMGNKSVSYLQLPTDQCDVVALTRVSQKKKRTASVESLIFEIDRMSLKDKGNEQSRRRSCKSKDNQTGRKTDKESTKKHSEESREMNGHSKVGEYSSDESSASSKLMIKDPLKWFGVLVPQNLKDAQVQFSSAIDYVVQCANIQLKIKSIHSEYTNLLATKRNMTNKEPQS